MARADLTLFAHVVKRPEAELDLAQASLLVAETEYPDLDVARSIEVLDQLGTEARRRIGAESELALKRLLWLLYEELGFRGNSEDYYDPRNSFLNDVLERRIGIPISLAVVLIETGARLGVALEGVGFPGHFL